MLGVTLWHCDKCDKCVSCHKISPPAPGDHCPVLIYCQPSTISVQIWLRRSSWIWETMPTVPRLVLLTVNAVEDIYCKFSKYPWSPNVCTKFDNVLSDEKFRECFYFMTLNISWSSFETIDKIELEVYLRWIRNRYWIDLGHRMFLHHLLPPATISWPPVTGGRLLRRLTMARGDNSPQEH